MIDGALSPARRILRGAIVGYGFIAENGHVPAYVLPGATDFRIVAVADSCAARRAKAKRDLPDARIYASHEELLAREREAIDFVDVCTPPSAHAPIARAALSNGLHVLCEKPLATSVMDARGMIARAAEARRVLFPSHNYKHAPVIQAVRRRLDANLIGPVKLVTLHTFRTAHARGVESWRPDWRRERRFAGGGIAMDHGSHTLYLAFDWLGAYPTAVTAKATTLGEFDTEDNFSCALTFPGATATAHLSWTAGVRKVIYTIHAEHGAIRVEDDDVEVAVKVTQNAKAAWEVQRERIASDWMDASHVGWFRVLFQQFASAIANHDFVGRDTVAGLRTVEVIEAAYASAIDRSRERSLHDEP